MAVYDMEWRILQELAKKPVATPDLRTRLSLPASSHILTTRLGRLRAWGWMKGTRRAGTGLATAVTFYSITEQGLRALSLARQRGFEVGAIGLAQELGSQEEVRVV